MTKVTPRPGYRVAARQDIPVHFVGLQSLSSNKIWQDDDCSYSPNS